MDIVYIFTQHLYGEKLHMQLLLDPYACPMVIGYCNQGVNKIILVKFSFCVWFIKLSVVIALVRENV